MPLITVSPKYQVVIPKEIREALKLEPGQKIHIMLIDGRIEMIPVEPIQNLRGFVKGIDTEIERGDDRY